MDESELRNRFTQLRDADRERAPSFAQSLSRARVRRRLGATRRLRPLVIGVAAAAVAGGVWLAQARSFSPPAVAPAIATWRAPTDVFLRTPGNELLGALPALGASVLDTLIPAPSKKGA